MTHAMSVPECEDGIRMSSLAACIHLAAAGAEPVLHILTRDSNRIALQAMILGAASMGINNIFCTTGRHQVLTSSRSARGVYDIDQIQLLTIADKVRKTGELADGQSIDSPIDMLLGTETNPFSDPMELQVMALEKAIAAGADFIVTAPVFNLEKFNTWMDMLRQRNLVERACVIASVMPILSSQQAADLAQKYSHLDISDDIVRRLDSASDSKSAGIDLAREIITSLRATDGIRGIHLVTGEDFTLAKEILSISGLARS